MEVKFTPGPWHIREFDGSKWSIDAEGDLTVAQAQQVRDLASDLKQEERSANARLIAAAPAMFVELMRLATAGVADGWSGCVSCRYVEGAGHAPDCRLAAAITEATGETVKA